MPERCASIRSMAKKVLPVLVGPKTALTLGAGADRWIMTSIWDGAPRAGSLWQRQADRIAPFHQRFDGVCCGCSYTDWNGQGTNHGRITNSINICVCSHTFSCLSRRVNHHILWRGPDMESEPVCGDSIFRRRRERCGIAQSDAPREHRT